MSSSFSFGELISASITNEVPVEYLVSRDKIRLAYYHFRTNKPAMANVVFIHGGGAHSNLGYTHLAQTLKDRFTIETYLFDLRGHGKSGGKRGDSPTPEMVWEDIKRLIEKIKTENNNTIYLAGHSSGAGTVLNYSSWENKEPVSGYFFVSPELGIKSHTSKKGRMEFAKVDTLKFILNVISGGRLFQNDYAVFFNYPDSVLKYQPLIVSAITVNMSKALTPANPAKQFMKLTEPFGLFIGSKDELFDAEKVLEFGNIPVQTNSNKIIKSIEKASHLSILINIGDEIGKAILKWQT